MEQVEQMCDDICLVSRGRIVLDGPLRTVKRRFGRDAVTITFEGRDDFLKQLVAEGSIKIGTHSRNRAEVRLLNGTPARRDRKSTRLNSSHVASSYGVCRL